ncbi:MAG: GspE/PulE family protein [Deltaproteobacteria bacterium]|nr:GspE/PulE family protein [Deltaproteobacteria bacterium]
MSRIGDLLIARGLISERQLEIALIQQRTTGAILGDTLISLGFVTAKEFAVTIADQSGITYLDLDSYVISEDALRLFSKETAQKAAFIPLELSDGVLSIGVINPSNIIAVDTALKATGHQPRVFLVDQDSFNNAIEKAYYFVEHPVKQRITTLLSSIRKATGGVSGVLTTELNDLLIMDGIRKGATDVHITPAMDVLHIFYRIDGVLHYGHCLPKPVQQHIVSRIKIMSQLDIAEQRLPQDGSLTFEFLNNKYDLRVSTIPTIFGENVVIRILHTSGALMNITSLGLAESEVARIRHLFRKSHGVILITGPTGSGKTTTLYAALREINLLERNVITVEDPVEYRLSFVRQTEVNERSGYGFALAARNFMRQDPDVMLLGEIRDEETAQIAVRASITGHLVLSTLHTNDAVTAVPRLLDLKMDRLLLSTSLLAVVAQRLARKICPHCREEYILDDEERKMFTTRGIERTTAFRGKGCERCDRTGYLGRIAICEILVINDEMREMIYNGVSSIVLTDTAIRSGMTTMLDDGVRKVAANVTTFSEIMRVVG